MLSLPCSSPPQLASLLMDGKQSSSSSCSISVCFTIKFSPLAQAFTVSFLHGEEPSHLRSTPWRAYRTRVAISWFPSWHSETIWNAHIPPIAIIHHFTHPQRDGRLSELAGSGAPTPHLSHKSQTGY